ncbi:MULTISPECIES: helix-turn-helix domain-containing protein [unclassified Microbacterium]|uniref:helix-turn-helix domain-containing protein n=1 Tax=unclassified Microbacterium TaxID=2609290 RepID=UPI000EA9E797|nr:MULTISPECIES: helix-turn-helix transcriptional regulator [unclassified Microbacterium]MBT2484068.1 helix-turn-helix domain-containing protein [Microbacterium sp. ISL-108]RKN69463.1 XRE family transcriptional regulator [Microbacterium sp. CGR2]
MTNQSELGQFLRVRRAVLQPEDVGLTGYGIRRVPGLRREELAMLAGVSSTYYTRLEQGLSVNASESVISAIARAMNLTADERTHLMDLARPQGSPRRKAAARADHARPGTLRLIHSLPHIPAVIIGRRSEVLAWNALGHRLVAGHFDVDSPDGPNDRPNMTRMIFLDAHTRELYGRWGEEAERAVSSLRVLAAKNPDDPELAALVGELTLKSPEFCALWSRHPVAVCVSGVKLFHHPDVGDFELAFEVLTPPDDSLHRVLLFTPEAGSPAEEALQLLGRDLRESETLTPSAELLTPLLTGVETAPSREKSWKTGL